MAACCPLDCIPATVTSAVAVWSAETARRTRRLLKNSNQWRYGDSGWIPLQPTRVRQSVVSAFAAFRPYFRSKSFYNRLRTNCVMRGNISWLEGSRVNAGVQFNDGCLSESHSQRISEPSYWRGLDRGSGCCRNLGQYFCAISYMKIIHNENCSCATGKTKAVMLILFFWSRTDDRWHTPFQKLNRASGRVGETEHN